MKNLFIIPMLALMFFSFQTKAQSNDDAKQEVVASSDSDKQNLITTVKFKITGITCAGCSNTIYNALKEVDGVVEHSVKYPGDIAIIRFNASKTNVKALKEIIQKKGYKVELVKDKA